MRIRSLLVLLAFLVSFGSAPVSALEGDTLSPVELESAPVETYPDGLLAESDFEAIETRVREARESGVPLAVRIVDMSQEPTELPFPLRQYAREDLSQPFSEERQDAIIESWIDNETIETSPGANDGFLLLVLVPEDRTQTMAMWWIGDNALPLNGLTEANTLATLGVMNEEFAEANMPNGVYVGIIEFLYNIQFGEPLRTERSELGEALHKAMYPLAGVVAFAGISIPLLAWILARRNRYDGKIEQTLTPWQAAALHLNRARPDITTAMLLDAIHAGDITQMADGSLRIETTAGNPAVEALRPFANGDDIVPAEAMLEVEAITSPVRQQIENELATSNAMTPRVLVDRTWMLIVMGITLLLCVFTAVPTVASMSRWGMYAIGIGLIGLFIGWWWLANRTYTTPAGKVLLNTWLENAPAEDRMRFDTATNLDLFTDQIGGPDVNQQTRLVRQLRGLSVG